MTTLNTEAQHDKTFTPHNTQQENRDRMARELYQHHGYCGACRKSIAVADALLFHCPHCGALYLAGMITPDEGREMLATLKARRMELNI